MGDIDAKLIELVRANPDLLERNLRAEPYDSMKKKIELWRSIATSLKIDVKRCILRWKSLREKLRRECAKERPGGGGSDWPLLEQMRFVEQHIKYYGAGQLRVQTQKNKMSLDDLNVDQLVEEIYDDDALQEAMDEQQIIVQSEIQQMHDTRVTDADMQQLPTSSTATSKVLDAETIAAAKIANADHLKRIETLLGGLTEPNRQRAEKRIIAFLCKCNLRELGDEHIDDLVI